MKDLRNYLRNVSFISLMFVITSSHKLLSDLGSVFRSIEYSSGTIKDVDVSLFCLKVITDQDTFKIQNNPAIIALSCIILEIILLAIQYIIKYVKAKKKA